MRKIQIEVQDRGYNEATKCYEFWLINHNNQHLITISEKTKEEAIQRKNERLKISEEVFKRNNLEFEIKETDNRIETMQNYEE